MLFPVVEARRNRRRPRSETSNKDRPTNNEKYATIPGRRTSTIGLRLLIGMAIVFDQIPESKCLNMRDRCHFYGSKHYNPSSKSISQLFSERQRDFSWSRSASVMDLFEVLDEESDDADNWNDDDDMDETSMEEESDLAVSDAEALLACWSFLKRRKRLGEWKEHEERKSQSLLSQNYFLMEDEEGDNLLVEDDDDDDDDELNQKLLQDKDDDFDFDFDAIRIDDDADSMTTVADILAASSIPKEDQVSDVDGVAQDLITISNFVAQKNGTVTSNSVGAPKSGDKEDIDLWYTEFTSFPKEANPSRKRRVDAMKRRWEDPEYRKRWYEKRWGSESNHQARKETDQEKQAVQRARALPSGFLGSEELASMTEDEIAEAIRTRIESTQKRVASRKETLQMRSDLLATQIQALENLSDEDSDTEFEKDEDFKQIFFSPSEKRLKEAQQKRSERAKKLYATRLENQNREKEGTSAKSSTLDSGSSSTSKSVREKSPYFPPKQLTPRDAFLRIESDLDHGVKPSVDDVHLVLKPGKMKNRKLLLVRILEEQFHLTGKCVPPLPEERTEDGWDGATDFDVQDLAFVKRCTIERLGTFVVHLLQKEESS